MINVAAIKVNKNPVKKFPIAAMQKWGVSNSIMYRTYDFADLQLRNEFIVSLLTFEQRDATDIEVTYAGRSVFVRVGTSAPSGTKPEQSTVTATNYIDKVYKEIVTINAYEIVDERQ